MQTYLVLSDSHGRTAELQMILEKEARADGFIFLGDGVRDISFPSPYTFGKPVYAVKSMRDFGGFNQPLEMTLTIDGVKVYLCHGDHLGTDVKIGYGSLLNKGAYTGAAICFFGHTHRQTLLEYEGLTLFSPGAVKDGRYGLFRTDGGKFTLEHKTI